MNGERAEAIPGPLKRETDVSLLQLSFLSVLSKGQGSKTLTLTQEIVNCVNLNLKTKQNKNTLY